MTYRSRIIRRLMNGFGSVRVKRLRSIHLTDGGRKGCGLTAVGKIPASRNWVLSVKFVVSTTSVLPSQWPRESPSHWRTIEAGGRVCKRDNAHVMDHFDRNRHISRRLEDLIVARCTPRASSAARLWTTAGSVRKGAGSRARPPGAASSVQHARPRVLPGSQRGKLPIPDRRSSKSAGF